MWLVPCPAKPQAPRSGEIWAGGSCLRLIGRSAKRCVPLLLGNTSFAQTFGHTGDDLGSDAPRDITHDGSDRGLGMKLAQAAQALLHFVEPTQMTAEAELEAKRGQPAIFAQCCIGPRQPRLVTTGRQMRKGLRLD